MKSRVIFLLLMLISSFAFGQDLKVEVPEVKVTPPKFAGFEVQKTVVTPGSPGTLEAYLRENIQYPNRDAESSNEGTEVIQFSVSPTGEVSDFVVINSVSAEMDKEVIRVLKTTSGMWMPGYNNDQPVAMEREISVAFKLDDGDGKSSDFYDLGQWYYKRGSTMLLIKNKPKKAVKNYDKAVVMLPNDKSLLIMRGLARFEKGDKDGACRDWQRIKTLGGEQGDFYLDNFCEMKGYAEMIRILEE